MKKSERLALIKELVLNNDIETQHDLLEKLEEQKISFTQATISRDMNEIGIVKIPTKQGRYIYGISKEKTKKVLARPKPVKSTILGVKQGTDSCYRMLHLDVTPGNSKIIKRLLLEEFSSRIFSLVADDDSLLLIAQTDDDVLYLKKCIEDWKSETM